MPVNYGTIAVIPKGEWNAGTQYKVGNVVSFDGSSYIAHTRPPVGTLPTNTDYWQVSAQGASRATADSLGVVKPDGETLEVDSSGIMSAKTATQETAGIVKGSPGITIGEDGSLDVNTAFEQAAELANIIAGEAIAQVLGKVSKAIAATMDLDQNALLKNMLTNIDANDSTKVPTSAFIHTLYERIGMGTELAAGDNLTVAVNRLNNGLEAQSTVYAGKDLTKVFAAEIANYSDEWAWIKARITKADYTGIHIGDYIPLTVKNETHQMQVAGIDTYYRTTDQLVGHHIDFISKDCFSETVKWNETDNNNGNTTDPHPYMVSNLKTWLNNTLYSYLPEKVKEQITNKRSLLEARYSASGTLNNSTGWSWRDIGKLWVPHEFEVFGAVIWGTPCWSQGQAMQYPIFSNSWYNRIKDVSDGNGDRGRGHWWLMTVKSDNSATVCGVGGGGTASGWSTTSMQHVPICFRIAA